MDWAKRMVDNEGAARADRLAGLERAAYDRATASEDAQPAGFPIAGVNATGPRNSPNIASRAMPPTGLEIVFLDNRDRLIRFMRARGAGHSAEDFVHDLWVNVSAGGQAPVANPMAYLFRAADRLMIDRYRSRRQAERRDQAWQDDLGDNGSAAPNPEREVSARLEVARVASVLEAMDARKVAVFRRVRIEGVPQRHVAQEFGISLSTVESDLREVARALMKLKEEIR